jgi:hypothetical protein
VQLDLLTQLALVADAITVANDEHVRHQDEINLLAHLLLTFGCPVLIETISMPLCDRYSDWASEVHLRSVLRSAFFLSRGTDTLLYPIDVAVGPRDHGTI